MTDKTMTADEVVSRLSSGMTIGIGGWGSRRKPMALVRALLRSRITDLTVVSYGGPDVGLLAAAGRIRKLVAAFATLDSIPLEPHFRAARQRGALELMEVDEAMFMWGLHAAANRLPFLPVRAGIGSDVMRVNPALRTVRSPYADGEEFVAMPALRMDAALVHLNRADRSGNGQYLGPDPYFDDLFCEAADTAYVSCERLVETAELTARAAPRPCSSGGTRSPASSRPRTARTSPPAPPTTRATRRSRRHTPPRPPTRPPGRRSPPASCPPTAARRAISRPSRPGTRSRSDDPWDHAARHPARHPRRVLRDRLRRRLA